MILDKEQFYQTIITNYIITMMYIKTVTKLPLYSYLMIFLCIMVISSISGQTLRQKKMEKLNFMIGEWVGTSTSFKNDTISKQVPAFEKISYSLDKNLITIDLHSQSLQLHTVIYYNEKDEKFYYTPYSKRGTGTYPATYNEGEFTVWFSEKRRLIFRLTPEGNFQEYGEKLEKGIWSKYFEDILKKAP